MSAKNFHSSDGCSNFHFLDGSSKLSLFRWFLNFHFSDGCSKLPKEKTWSDRRTRWEAPSCQKNPGHDKTGAQQVCISVSVSDDQKDNIGDCLNQAAEWIQQRGAEASRVEREGASLFSFLLFHFFLSFLFHFFLLLTFILKGASLREERSNTVDCSGRFDLKSLTIFIDEYNNGDDDGVVDTNESYPIPFTNF